METAAGPATRRWCRRCDEPVSGGRTPLDKAVHAGTGEETCADGQVVAPTDIPPAPRQDAPKPTPADLGIDLSAQRWERSGDGGDCLEVAFPAGTWERGDWVLMRKAGDPSGLVLVFDRNEWECFLDGARNGEFDDATA